MRLQRFPGPIKPRNFTHVCREHENGSRILVTNQIPSPTRWNNKFSLPSARWDCPLWERQDFALIQKKGIRTRTQPARNHEEIGERRH